MTDFGDCDKLVTEFGDCDRVWGIVTEFGDSDQSVTEFVLRPYFLFIIIIQYT